MHFARPLALAVLSLSALAQRTEIPDRSWTQAQGNALGTAAVDVDPIRADPGAGTSIGAAFGEPVSWDRTLYFCTKSGEALTLKAFDLVDKAALGSVGLGKGELRGLFAWEGEVGVALGAEIVMYEVDFAKKKLTEVRRIPEALAVAPRVVAGTLFGDGTSVKAYATKSGKLRGGFAGTRGPSCLRLGGSWGVPAYASLKLAGEEWSLELAELDDLAALKINRIGGGNVALGSAPAAQFAGATVARVQPDSGVGGWIVTRSEGSWFVADGASSKPVPAPFVGGVSVVRGGVVGFDASGALVRMEASGSLATILAADGGAKGPISVARDVAYAGGRAIDLASGKVLWQSAKFAPERRAFPVGDQLVVVSDAKGALTLLVGKAPKKGASAGAAANAVLPRPGGGNGVVLNDGTYVAGKVSSADGGWRVESDDGRSSGYTASDVALVEQDGTVQLLGDEEPVLQSFQAALDAEHATRVVEAFDLFLKQRLDEDCKRLLAEAKQLGLDSARVAELDAKVKALKPNDKSNKEALRKAPLGKELELRKVSRAAYGAAAAWCAANDLKLTASLLLIEGAERSPLEGKPDAEVQPLIPAEFPWKESPEAVARWASWAPRLVRTGAFFVPREDRLYRVLTSGAWKDGVIILRTKNVTLCSRPTDPGTVGDCLDAAEFAIRTLRELLPPDPDTFTQPLQVRLFATRDEYLAEPAGGGRPPEWSAGLYSGGISRFYVPSGVEAQDPYGRGVFSVVSHELTHHYLDVAWLAKGTKREPEGSNLPGYWIVEGTARFIEEAVADRVQGRKGRKQRDPACAYVCKQASALQKLFPTTRLVDMNASEFAGLGNDEIFQLPPLNEGVPGNMVISQRSIFYEQAGSLVFFLMYRAGPEPRAKVVEYLRARYLGQTTPEGWKLLGYQRGDALETAFKAFVDNAKH
jgi:hypothetical protein